VHCVFPALGIIGAPLADADPGSHQLPTAVDAQRGQRMPRRAESWLPVGLNLTIPAFYKEYVSALCSEPPVARERQWRAVNGRRAFSLRRPSGAL
jgi:hypothetical protein